MKCKEYLCNGKVPKGKSLESFACQSLHLCKYCYRMKFPKRKMWNLPVCRQGSQKLLSYGERRYLERRKYDALAIFLWSPEFFYEVMDALDD